MRAIPRVSDPELLKDLEASPIDEYLDKCMHGMRYVLSIEGKLEVITEAITAHRKAKLAKGRPSSLYFRHPNGAWSDVSHCLDSSE